MSKIFLVLFSIFLMNSSVYAGEIIGLIQIKLKAPDPQAPISPFAHNRGGAEPRVVPAESRQSVIYLSASPLLPEGVPPLEPPVMDQRNLTLIPHILPILVGSTVLFPNSDALYHNLFSLSPARKFDLGRYPKGASKSTTFMIPGEVHIFCDIHPSMSAVILVLPNKFFSMADSNGEFRLVDVPAGTWTINAWHEQLSEVSQTVNVPQSGSVSVILNLQD